MGIVRRCAGWKHKSDWDGFGRLYLLFVINVWTFSFQMKLITLTKIRFVVCFYACRWKDDEIFIFSITLKNGTRDGIRDRIFGDRGCAGVRFGWRIHSGTFGTLDLGYWGITFLQDNRSCWSRNFWMHPLKLRLPLLAKAFWLWKW